GIFLTNALTGSEPPQKSQKQAKLPFPEFEQEREAAQDVKRDKPILVILGNPPYNGFAGIAIAEEHDLTQAYRTTRRAPKPEGQGLNDLYVRFFRMAERRIVEKKPGRGVVCLISNYSWLDGLSFTGMREHYLGAFDRIWIDCLNGDKYKTGKLTPEGAPDPSIFSTESSAVGIQVGTAIALLVRRQPSCGSNSIAFRHLWGKGKLSQLQEEASAGRAISYTPVEPPLELGLPFFPSSVAPGYLTWPLLADLFPVSFPGVKTSRDEFVVEIDRERLLERLQAYFDPAVTDDELRGIAPTAITDAARFDAKQTREYLVKRGFKSENVVRYCYRPFDVRWLYWEPETKLLDEKRADYVPQVFESNLWIAAARRNRKDFDPPFLSKRLCSLHVIERGANLFPAFTKLETHGTIHENLAPRTAPFLKSIRLESVGAPILTLHSAAILYSPKYVHENLSALRLDWPRIPLPDSKHLLENSAELGERIAALLDTENSVVGVTSGNVRPELRVVGVETREGGKPLNPDAGDLDLTAGWGHLGKDAAVMPGGGKTIQRDYSPAERAAIKNGAKALGLSPADAFRLLGDTTLDVYLNDVAYWRNVPAAVWNYTIGGYQVIKKWLSYREKKILGRPLTRAEVYEVRDMARRIAAIVLLGPSLDANYQAIKSATYPFPTGSKVA
ncbi:MAG: type ISP restriction/modification enzyme, partial [Methyloceanibacter sp.]